MTIADHPLHRSGQGSRVSLVVRGSWDAHRLFRKTLAKVAGRYLKMIARLKKVGVLILDDFALRRYTHDEANMLMELLEERYQKGINIVSSQVSPAG